MELNSKLERCIRMSFESRNLKVFLSSSMVEFADERKDIWGKLEELRIPSYVFEKEGASEYDPQKEFREAVTAASVYVGVFGKAWGTHTKEEYNLARKHNISCHLYFQDIDKVERSKDLQNFIESLNGVDGVPTSCKFKSKDQLIKQILVDLVRWLDRKVAVNSPQNDSDAIQALFDQFQKLITEIIEANQQISVNPPLSSQYNQLDTKFNLPVLCNREEQHEEIRDQVLAYFEQKPRRPLILVLPGRKEEEHGYFLTRVEWHSLPKVLPIIPQRARESHIGHNVKMIPINGEGGLSIEKLRQKIAEKLSVPITQDDSFLLDDIKGNNYDACLIGITINSRACQGDFTKPLKVVQEYWGRMVGIPEHVLFGSLVCLVDEQVSNQNGKWMKGVKGFLGHTPDNDLLPSEKAAQGFYKLTKEDSRLIVKCLPCLKSPQFDHGNDWRKLDEVNDWIKKFCPHHPIKKDEIKKIFGRMNHLSMESLYDELLGLLAKRVSQDVALPGA